MVKFSKNKFTRRLFGRGLNLLQRALYPYNTQRISPPFVRGVNMHKLREYFLAGTELVWYIEPPTRSATVYTSPDQPTEIGPDGVLKGGDVLLDFELPLRQLFSGAEIAPSRLLTLSRMSSRPVANANGQTNTLTPFCWPLKVTTGTS